MWKLFPVKMTKIIKQKMVFLEFEITVRKSDSTIFHYDDPVRLIKIGFAFCFEEVRLSTTLVSVIETNKSSGLVSTLMRVIS